MLRGRPRCAQVPLLCCLGFAARHRSIGARRDCPSGPHLGTQLGFDESSGEISSIKRVAAGYGKVAVIQELESKFQVTPDRTVYMGDGSSDMFVMLHVNSREGYTIAVSEAKFIGSIAHRTVLSDSALSVLVPILEHILRWTSGQIRALFESFGLSSRSGTRPAPTG